MNCQLVIEEDTSCTPNMNNYPLPSISRIQIHTDGVAKLLQNIQVRKAGVPDDLPTHFLKGVAEEISPVLTIIFKLF